MDKIKSLFKRTGITALIILIYGIIIGSKEVYFGMFSGALVSILGLYLLCLDVRYALYGVYLGVMAKFFGLSMIICSGLGLLNVKANILLMALSDKVIKIRDKNLK